MKDMLPMRKEDFDPVQQANAWAEVLDTLIKIGNLKEIRVPAKALHLMSQYVFYSRSRLSFPYLKRARIYCSEGPRTDK